MTQEVPQSEDSTPHASGGKPRDQLRIVDNFLSAEFCGQLIAEACSQTFEPATVSQYGHIRVVRTLRNSDWTTVTLPSLSRIERLLRSKLVEFSSLFGIGLTQFQEPHIIRYEKACFHGPHIDSPANLADPTQSKVTCVVFLNSHREFFCDGFSGGELLVHGCSQTQDGIRTVRPKIGRMVAFWSSSCHEVRPVLSGNRYSLATWFL